MRQVITGTATGDILGWFDPVAETVTDIQNRIAGGIKNYSQALTVMREFWSWNV